MERRKVKNGEKSRWGQCLKRPVPNGRRPSGFWLVPEKHKFSGTNQKPERQRPFGTGLVRHCLQGLFSPFFTFLRATFSRPFRLSLVPTICPWVSEDGFTSHHPFDGLTMLVNSLVISRLDYCNSLLFDIPKYQRDKLWRIRKTAARMITGARSSDHITPILNSLPCGSKLKL